MKAYIYFNGTRQGSYCYLFIAVRAVRQRLDSLFSVTMCEPITIVLTRDEKNESNQKNQNHTDIA